MFELMGDSDPCSLEASDEASRLYFERTIPDQLFFGWVAETGNNEPIGAGGMVIDQHPPGPQNLTGQIAYIMNVVVDPRFQRQGIARALMKQMLAWAEVRGIHLISLHASEMGRPLYHSMGFSTTTEMRKQL